MLASTSTRSERVSAALLKQRFSVSRHLFLALMVVLIACTRQATLARTGSSALTEIAAAAAQSAYANAVMADAPIAYWRLGDSDGSNTSDASGYGAVGALRGGVSLVGTGALIGDPDGAMLFDGQTGSIRSASDVSVSGDFTIEAWVNFGDSGSGGTIVSLYAGGEQAPGVEQSDTDRLTRTVSFQDGRFVGVVDLSSEWPKYAVYSTPVDPTTWHQVVFTVANGTDLGLFVDGEPSGSASVPATPGFTARPVLGWSDATWVQHFDGTLDEVALYSSRLSFDQIQAHYVAGGPRCGGSLQHLIDVAPAGAIVSVPPCTYRESVTINKPLTLAGQPGAEIRGSDIWNAWLPTGRLWISQQAVPPLPHRDNSDQRCGEASLRCLLPEQVFIDGRALYPVGAGPTPVTGQFALDAARHVILADNPAGHSVEVTTRSRWVISAADDVSIQGFKMRGAGNDAQTGAISNDGYSNWTLQDNALSDAHGAVVSLMHGTNLRVLRNDVSRGGSLGLHGTGFSNSLIQGNHLHDNNSDLFNSAWEAGALKTGSASGLVVDSNEVDHSGIGLWCDEGCANVTLSANRVHDNAIAGMIYEISNSGIIRDNTFWSNGAGSPWVWGGGIVISSSATTEIYNNTLAWNRVGISLVEQVRPGSPAVRNLRVHDNTILSQDRTLALAWTSDTQEQHMFDSDAANYGMRNRYWYPVDESAEPRFAWRGNKTRLVDFTQTPGDSDGAYISAAGKDQLMASRSIPAPG
jgi:parallel beta-helix repeat protein